MTYYMPVKVYDEAEAVKNHGAEIASFGKKALIITFVHILTKKADYYRPRFGSEKRCSAGCDGCSGKEGQSVLYFQ